MSEEIIKILMNMEREIGEIKATGLTTLAQATKTNGRVTCLEESNIKLSNILSRHDNQLTKIDEIDTVKNKDDKLLIRRVSWILGIGLLLYIFKDIPQITSFLFKTL